MANLASTLPNAIRLFSIITVNQNHNTGQGHEDALIRKCVEWDRNAQNALYKMFASRMFTVCLRYSSSREEAEDILQEGFMKVFENIKNFRREGSLEGWIRKIMMNEALQKFRSSKHENFSVSISDNENYLPHYSDETILSRIGIKELMSMIQNLSPAYRMVFNLYVFEGMKHREIAEQLGISEGTSKSNLADARSILQKAVNNSLRTAVEPTEHG
jgi:RNA polymerase sigma-70 factor (ECF subfamily)